MFRKDALSFLEVSTAINTSIKREIFTRSTFLAISPVFLGGEILTSENYMHLLSVTFIDFATLYCDIYFGNNKLFC